jgi:hypothetical protein
MLAPKFAVASASIVFGTWAVSSCAETSTDDPSEEPSPVASSMGATGAGASSGSTAPEQSATPASGDTSSAGTEDIAQTGGATSGPSETSSDGAPSDGTSPSDSNAGSGTSASETTGADTADPTDDSGAIDTATTDEGAGGGGGGDTSDSVGGGGGMPTTSAGGAGGEVGDVGAGGDVGMDQTSTQDAGTPEPVTGDPCPADATFCSGFDTDELPEGAVFKLNGDPATPWTALFEIDSSVQLAGASSLRVRKNAEPNASTMYKMLAVPSGGASFWVRMYLRSDVELGQEGHNAYAAASENDDPNDGSRVEFADDVGLSFNASDDVRWPEGYGRLTTGETNPYTLPADEWHCIELYFDGAARTQSLFIEGEEVLVASDYPGSAMNFGVFKFGYQGFHNEADRGVWYDEVAVGPSRIGCL